MKATKKEFPIKGEWISNQRKVLGQANTKMCKGGKIKKGKK